MEMLTIPACRFEPSLAGAFSKVKFRLTFDAHEVGESHFDVHALRGGEGPVLLVTAGVHGDEYEGVQTIIELGRELAPDELAGTLLLVPVANVLAYRGISRTTPEDGKNLAREFPGDPNGSVTERLAWWIGERLIRKSDFYLDLHSGGTNYVIPPLVGYDLSESEAGRRSREAAEAFGMEVIWGHSEVAPGRTISAAAAWGIPWLYTEASGGRRVRPDELNSFKSGVLRLLKHMNMLRAPQQRIEQEAPSIRHRLIGDGNYDASVVAGEEGFFIPSVRLLDEVRTGDPIGKLYNGFGEVLVDFRAKRDGIMIGLTGTPFVRKGDHLYSSTGRSEG